MRIGFAYDSAYPWFKGGIEKRKFLIMNALKNAGHEVHAFTMFREGMPSDEFTYKGIHYHCCGSAMPTSAMYRNGRRNISWPLKYATLLDLKIWKYRFDLFDAEAFPFLHIPKLAAYARLTGAKFVVTWAEVWDRNYWESYLPTIGLLGYVAEKISARLSTQSIAISSATKGKMVEVLKVPQRKITVFPAAIDGKEIGNILKRKIKKSDKFVVIGRLVPEKRVDMAIMAVAGTGAELIIIGTGPERLKLLALAKKLGLEKKVRIEDIQEREAVLRHICEARGMLMFSAREGLSIVSIEALALGTPVIIVRSTSLTKEIRRHCYTVDERDLSGSISRLLNNKKSMLYSPNIDRRRILEEFSAERSEQVYKKILDD